MTTTRSRVRPGCTSCWEGAATTPSTAAARPTSWLAAPASTCFTRTQANGDTVTDFTPGTDHIGFIGYGAGSFTQLNATQWQVVSQDGLTAETINFSNGAQVQAADFLFI